MASASAVHVGDGKREKDQGPGTCLEPTNEPNPTATVDKVKPHDQRASRVPDAEDEAVDEKEEFLETWVGV